MFVLCLAKYPHDSHSKNAYLRKVLQQKYAPLCHKGAYFYNKNMLPCDTCINYSGVTVLAHTWQYI